MLGCHGDGNKRNNQLWNLRWDTHQANMDDAKKHRTSKPERGAKTTARVKLKRAEAELDRLKREYDHLKLEFWRLTGSNYEAPVT